MDFASPPPNRNSKNIEVNQRGRDVLDSCKSLDLRIVNGRKTGDPFGDFTCIKYNGNSLVDYLITSPSTFENLSYFKIGNFLPWFSDHCPLLYTLEVRNGQHNDNISNKDPKIKAPKQFMWTDDSKENFLACLNSPNVKLKLDQSIEVDHSDPNLLVNYVSDIIIDTAKMAKVP